MDAQLKRRRAQPPGTGPPPEWGCRAVHSPPRRFRSQVRPGESGHGWVGREAVSGRRGSPVPQPEGCSLVLGGDARGCSPLLGGDTRECSPLLCRDAFPFSAGMPGCRSPRRTGQRLLLPPGESRSAAGPGSRPLDHGGLGGGAARPLQLSPCFCPCARGSAAGDVSCYVNTRELRWGLGYGRSSS